MNKLFFLLLCCLSIATVATAQHEGHTMQAATDSADVAMQNYVVMTKKVPQLKPILLTAEAFRREDGAAYGDFRIIICGQDIGQITDAELMQPYIDQAHEAGATLVACGFSLKKFGVDPAKVPAGIEVVDNGIQYDFSLQKKGYYSISL